MDPERREIFEFEPEHHRHDDVADDHDGEIGRSVIGLMMMELFAAIRAIVRDFQEFAEQAATAASRATAAETAQNRGERRAGGRVGGFVNAGIGHVHR